MIGASLLFGVAAGFVLLFAIGLVLGAFGVRLPFDLPPSRVMTFLAVSIAFWKAQSLKNSGWF